MSIATAVAFVKKYHAPLAWGLFAVTLVALVVGFAVHERRVGALNAALGSSTKTAATWQKKADSTDKVLKVQADSADKWHAKYDTARARVATRTVVKSDTVTRH